METKLIDFKSVLKIQLIIILFAISNELWISFAKLVNATEWGGHLPGTFGQPISTPQLIVESFYWLFFLVAGLSLLFKKKGWGWIIFQIFLIPYVLYNLAFISNYYHLIFSFCLPPCSFWQDWNFYYSKIFSQLIILLISTWILFYLNRQRVKALFLANIKFQIKYYIYIITGSLSIILFFFFILDELWRLQHLFNY